MYRELIEKQDHSEKLESEEEKSMNMVIKVEEKKQLKSWVDSEDYSVSQMEQSVVAKKQNYIICADSSKG
jgi:uncharacterized protein (DUF1330 family)